MFVDHDNGVSPRSSRHFVVGVVYPFMFIVLLEDWYSKLHTVSRGVSPLPTTLGLVTLMPDL